MPWIEPVTSTRTGASAAPLRTATIRRPAHGAPAGDARRQRRRRGGERCGDGQRGEHPVACHSVQTVIVGAGTFGASLAWTLARAGEDVVLVDQFEPGDARATSGGESRLIRCAHGGDALYTASARRARTLWRELEARVRQELMVEIGMAWFAQREDGWEAESERAMAAQGIRCERLDPADGREAVPEPRDRRPRVRPLRARGRRGARAAGGAGARRQAVAHGARLVQGRAAPDGDGAALGTATRLEGDAVVWACGPWLGGLFGELVPLKVTRQELLFFDGGPAWRSPGVPGWVDYDRAMYGTGDFDELGVKVALDKEGPPLEPDAELPPAGATEPAVRDYLAHRFPALADAPLNEGRCCRYELSRGLQLLRRPPSGARAHVGHRRRLGPRLQARSGARRADGGRPARRRGAAGALPPRSPRGGALVPDRRLRRALGARRRTTGRRARSPRRRAPRRGPRP